MGSWTAPNCVKVHLQLIDVNIPAATQLVRDMSVRDWVSSSLQYSGEKKKKNPYIFLQSGWTPQSLPEHGIRLHASPNANLAEKYAALSYSEVASAVIIAAGMERKSCCIKRVVKISLLLGRAIGGPSSTISASSSTFTQISPLKLIPGAVDLGEERYKKSRQSY